MCNYDYHLDQFKEFVNKNHGVIPSNTRDCFNIFFCNEEWIPLMCCEKIEFDKYITTDVNKKGLLECYLNI